MANVEWVEPALLWDGRPLETLRRPRLLEIRSDVFMDEFLAAMANGAVGGPANGAPNGNGAGGDTADAGQYLRAKAIDGGKQDLKLYQPLHGCFYLVTGSLVCRQWGLPDRNVVRKNGEKTSFVVRRRSTVSDDKGATLLVEEGWVDQGPQRGWQRLVDAKGRPVAVRMDEERFPLHGVSVCTKSLPQLGGPALGQAGAQALTRAVYRERMVYHGYLPTGNREKYIAKFSPAPESAGDGKAALADYLATLKDVTDDLPAGVKDKDFDFRLDEFDSRVIGPWQALLVRAQDAKTPPPTEESKQQTSLYILLDLADNFSRILPTVWGAVMANNVNLLSTDASKKLWQVLDRTKLAVAGVGEKTLAQVLRDLAPSVGLVRGAEIPEPPAAYDLTDTGKIKPKNDTGGDISLADFVGTPATAGVPAKGAVLIDYIKGALGEETQQMTPTEELAGLLKDQVKLEPVDPATGKETSYFLRLVYEYDPACPPVVSGESQPFRLAKFFEPDAPARHIQIELPSIKMGDMRKFQRGVGLKMSPELRDVMNRVHKGMADGEDLLAGGGSWGLGMICSFSLQIIFLVAFIVMFIFLIMLNIVFWWLAFLKICFPIPVKK